MARRGGRLRFLDMGQNIARFATKTGETLEISWQGAVFSLRDAARSGSSAVDAGRINFRQLTVVV